MTPKELQEFEQGAASLAENLPPMFRRFFVNLNNEGFDQKQSMEILKTWIRTTFRSRSQA